MSVRRLEFDRGLQTILDKTQPAVLELPNMDRLKIRHPVRTIQVVEDSFTYPKNPTAIFLRISGGDNAGLNSTSPFLTNIVTLTSNSNSTYSCVAFEPRFLSDRIIYNSTNIGARWIDPNGANDQSLGNFLNNTTENFGGGARLARMFLDPTGDWLYFWVRRSFTSGAGISLIRVSTSNIPGISTSNREILYSNNINVTPNGLTVDLGRRVFYLTWLGQNSNTSLIKINWDGSGVQVLKSHSNSVFQPQQWIGEPVYVPDNDYIYYMYSPDLSNNYEIELWKIKPDGTDDQLVYDFNVELGSYPSIIPLAYHYGAGYLLLDNPGDRGKLMALSLDGNVLATDITNFGGPVVDILFAEV